MLVALCSAKGSPGVSVSSLALASLWPSRVLLAECDPAGGDLRSGFCQQVDVAGRGVGRLATFRRRDAGGDLRRALHGELFCLNEAGGVMWLPGLTEPAEAGMAAGLWGPLGQTFAGLVETDPPTDVIADCGRLATTAPVGPLLASAGLVLLTVRPTVAAVAAAGAWLPLLRRQIPDVRRVRLLVVGGGSYSAGEVGRALSLPLAGELPQDPAAAAVFSGDGEMGRGFPRSPLVRAAHRLAGQLHAAGGRVSVAESVWRDDPAVRVEVSR
jgi:hypothetical protein